MKSAILSLLLFGGVFSSLAADRQVTEFGTGGGFASIDAAITAANDGDRIVIHPKAGNSPWVENLTITKSLTLFSASSSSKFAFQGTITFNPSAAGKTLTIVGMRNLVGDITTAINAPSGARAKVSILNSTFLNGGINFNANNFDLTLASDSLLDGYVYLRYGKVLGNYINHGARQLRAVWVFPGETPTEDTVFIVGNRILNSTSAGYDYWAPGWVTYWVSGIYWASSSQYYFIANNWVEERSNDRHVAVYLITGKSGSGRNTLLNNQVTRPGSAIQYGFASDASTIPANTDIFNNLVVAASNPGGHAYSFPSPLGFSCSFNQSFVGSTVSGIVNDGTNNFSAANTIDASTGALQSGSAGINAGYSNDLFSDLDLTRNDVGIFGGAYSHANFHPITGTNPRVSLVMAPRRTVVGTQIQIKATGFSR